jgi:hypothetical protein
MKLAYLFALTVLPACTNAKSAENLAVDLTNAACAVAVDSPVGQPWVDLICTGVQIGEGAVIDSGVLAAKSIRIRVPSTQANSILAMQKVDGGK